MTNLEKAKIILNAIVTGNTKEAQPLIAEHYIEHNPHLHGGKVSLIDMMHKMHALATEREKMHKPLPKATIMRVIEDGNYIALHIHYEHWYQEKPFVGFDLFRFENGLAVEHWDAILPIMPANPSGHTQLDGKTRPANHHHAVQNKKLVREFQEHLIAGEGLKALNYLHPNYIQHNPLAVDTRDGMMKLFTENAAKGIKITFKKIHHLIGEGDFVLMTYDADISGRLHHVFDLYRVENNLLVEHWDIMSPALPANQQVNKNSHW